MSFYECPKCGGIPGVTACCTAKPAQPAASAEPKPVAKITGIDEYGPRLEWSRHWADVGVGARLYTTPVAAQPSVPYGWKLVPANATKAQQDETEQLLLDRLSDLLKRTAIALKGPEADHMYDWSDLPEVAARAVEAAQRAVSIRSLKTEEAYNANIPVTEQKEGEWKRLEDRK